ncbi:MAG: hypothetical protein OXU27_02610 [Candidatus Poribacteria bacterium]|nr:hypothetical protein [Candidatus Poribacteria bacterium]
MINIEEHKSKILAAHIASTMKTSSPSEELEVFIRSHRAESQPLKQWWDDMDALRVIRYAEHQWRIHPPENDPNPNSIGKTSMGIDEVVLFAGKEIGKVYNYYRTVLPQEIQIRLAYDTLIERFIEFLQRKKCAIRLSENQLMVSLFIPDTNFQLGAQWQQFIEKFAYSEEELYKSFTLFVNSMKLTDRGFGYVHFPSVTEAMKLWQAAFYIATLEERVVRYPDNYRKAKTDEDRKAARKENKKELKRLLTELRDELQTGVHGSNASNEVGRLFDRALKFSYQFNRTGATQFSYGTVKPRANKGKIEDKIIEILSEQVRTLNCPLAPVDEVVQHSGHNAGDTVKNRCYSCGRLLPSRSEVRRFKGKLEANRFVFSDPSQRLQSGSGQVQPPICFDCLVVAFGCPIKLAGGAIIVHLFSPDEGNELVSREKYLQMLTLGELNLIAGRYLLIKCPDFVGSTPVSEKIGQVQYALWRVAQTLPPAALEEMQFTLYAGESEIPLPRRHLVWLSYLNEGFKPRLVVNRKDNIPLGQAIRLIQKDEVISAIYKLVAAEFPQVTPIHNQSYSEKQSLEELREKHCILLEKSSNGDKLMEKQAEFYRHVAALTGLTYAYCDYVRSELRGKEKVDTVQREVKKLIEKVVNPSFFNYEASDVLPGTRATMYRNHDNYFCYDQAKLLLENTLNVETSARAKPDEKGPQPLAIYFDDILNAYAKLSEKYNKTQRRKLSYQLKLNLYAKFASLFSQKGD